MEFAVFFVGILTLAGFYAILAMILNLEAGWGGMWDLGVAGLVAVGAYTYVLTTQTGVTSGLAFAPGWPLWAGVLAASAMTALVALLIGIPALRVRGEYFLITTLAFAEVIRQLTSNLTTVTRGTVGFSQLERPFESLAPGRAYRFVLFGLVLLAGVLLQLLLRRLGRSPYGRLLRASRDNEGVALSLGKHVTRYRIATFALSGALFGAVAPLYVWFIRSIVPSLFAADLTFTVWTALVIGGIGSFSGPVIGALILLVLTEMLQLIQGSAEYATLLASTRPIILGVLLILIMRLKPSGLLTERAAFLAASGRHPGDEVPGGLQEERA